jgi:hypothetical protein
MKDKLSDWYQQINEEDILPNGVIKINVPVVDADVPVADVPTTMVPPQEEKSDPVASKDKGISLRAFILAKQIQDSLVRLSGLVEPYEAESEERQKLSDSIKKLHRELGEEIACL